MREVLDDLDLLVKVLKERIQDNMTANEVLAANLEGWTDEMARQLCHRFSVALRPFIEQEKNSHASILGDIQQLESKLEKWMRALERCSKWVCISVAVHIAATALLWII